MLEAFSTPRNRNRTVILFAICGMLAVAAAAVGISDNPPACCWRSFQRVLSLSPLFTLGERQSTSNA